MESNKQRLERFVAWLADNGAEMDQIEVRETEHGNGVYAREAIGEESQFAQIPMRLVVTGRVCRAALGTDASESELRGRPLLCAFLIQQRFVAGTESFWHPYISILPCEFHTPLFFTDSELELLRGTPMAYAVEDRRQLLRAEHEELMQRVPETAIPPSVLTFENYLWAAGVVSSRAFTESLVSGTKDTDGETSVLLPLLDMMNHRPLTRISWIIDDSCIGFRSGAAIGKGCEVVNNYGGKSNEELLLGYGFCVPGNPLSCYHIKLNYTMDPLAGDKRGILEYAQMASCDHYIRAGGLPRELLPTLRVMAMTEADVYYVKQLVRSTTNVSSPERVLDNLGLRIELRARFLLSFLLRKKLDALPQADECTPMTENGRLAVHYRGEIAGILRSTLSDLHEAECRLLACASGMFADDLHSLPQFVCDNGQQLDADAIGAAGDADAAEATEADEPAAAKKPRQDSAAQRFVDDVLVTDESIARDAAFAAAVDQIDVEADVLLTLFVLRIRMCPFLPWHACVRRLEPFKHPMLVREDPDAIESFGEMMMEMGEIHDSLFPLLTEHFPDVFPKEHFTPELFLWAAGVVESFRLSVPARCLGAADGDDVEGLCFV
ncbi:hypothetical protein IWW50_003979 [Coemansia erecta]|nr:hypothetical protein GGF43_001301 [Coemansia sp. RSA 2618]KAJ2822987.1 hypothetical protein IWW50_003979 [Coemansia erecta]